MNAARTRKEEEMRDLEREYIKLVAAGLGHDAALEVMSEWLHPATLARFRQHLSN